LVGDGRGTGVVHIPLQLHLQNLSAWRDFRNEEIGVATKELGEFDRYLSIVQVVACCVSITFNLFYFILVEIY